jgi:2-phospho-L-lactate guanylyltransferase
VTEVRTPPRQVFALIPMKPFAEAKSRLSADVPAAARKALALAMFERVLLEATRCDALCGVAVLTYGADVALCARHAGAHVLDDAQLAERDLGSLIDAALPQLAALGADAAVILMADLPYLESADIAQLTAALAHADIALIADARGQSTNALALRLPATFPTAFGDPNSYALHLRRASDGGCSSVEIQNPRVAHDVDVRDDLPESADWARGRIFDKPAN